MNEEETNYAFAQRLHEALDLRNYPSLGHGRITYLQEIFGLSRAGANKWLGGKVFPHKKKRCEIAQKLGVSLHWLETGNGSPYDSDHEQYEPKKLVREIPLLSMIQAYDLTKSIENKNHKTMLISSEMPASVIAVIYGGNSMFPKFSEGSTLIVDIQQPLQDGDFVLAKTKMIPEAIVRQYVDGGENSYLAAINTKFDPITIDQTIQIIGRIIESRSKV